LRLLDAKGTAAGQDRAMHTASQGERPLHTETLIRPSAGDDVIEEPLAVRIPVRSDDLDTNGHVRGAAIVAYADHARWELVGEAGVSLDRLASAGLGPVNLETTIRFRRELRAGERVDVTVAEHDYGEGRTGRLRQELRLPDGTLVAEVTSVVGLLDLKTRRLVPGLRERWRALVDRPELLGL
jgi:acyl-CoA thioester hydrolase